MHCSSTLPISGGTSADIEASSLLDRESTAKVQKDKLHWTGTKFTSIEIQEVKI